MRTSSSASPSRNDTAPPAVSQFIRVQYGEKTKKIDVSKITTPMIARQTIMDKYGIKGSHALQFDVYVDSNDTWPISDEKLLSVFRDPSCKYRETLQIRERGSLIGPASSIPMLASLGLMQFPDSVDILMESSDCDSVLESHSDSEQVEYVHSTKEVENVAKIRSMSRKQPIPSKINTELQTNESFKSHAQAFSPKSAPKSGLLGREESKKDVIPLHNAIPSAKQQDASKPLRRTSLISDTGILSGIFFGKKKFTNDDSKLNSPMIQPASIKNELIPCQNDTLPSSKNAVDKSAMERARRPTFSPLGNQNTLDPSDFKFPNLARSRSKTVSSTSSNTFSGNSIAPIFPLFPDSTSFVEKKLTSGAKEKEIPKILALRRSSFSYSGEIQGEIHGTVQAPNVTSTYPEIRVTNVSKGSNLSSTSDANLKSADIYRNNVLPWESSQFISPSFKSSSSSQEGNKIFNAVRHGSYNSELMFSAQPPETIRKYPQPSNYITVNITAKYNKSAHTCVSTKIDVSKITEGSVIREVIYDNLKIKRTDHSYYAIYIDSVFLQHQHGACTHKAVF